MKTHFPIGKSFSSDCYVADYTNISGSERGVEISDKPFDDIEYFHLKKHTSGNINYWAINFEDYPDFIKGIQNCECCFDSVSDHGKPWLLFLETKYCEPQNIDNHSLKASSQMYDTYSKLIEDGVITPGSKTVYFNYSSPGNDELAPFKAFSYSQDSVLSKIKSDGIIMLGHNTLLIATPFHLFEPKPSI